MARPILKRLQDGRHDRVPSPDRLGKRLLGGKISGEAKDGNWDRREGPAGGWGRGWEVEGRVLIGTSPSRAR